MNEDGNNAIADIVIMSIQLRRDMMAALELFCDAAILALANDSIKVLSENTSSKLAANKITSQFNQIASTMIELLKMISSDPTAPPALKVKANEMLFKMQATEHSDLNVFTQCVGTG